MFLFFLHNHKSYLLLSVCLIGRNLGRLCQNGVYNVLCVLFDYRCSPVGLLYRCIKQDVVELNQGRSDPLPVKRIWVKAVLPALGRMAHR